MTCSPAQVLNTLLYVKLVCETSKYSAQWASLGVEMDKTPGGNFLDILCCKQMFLIYFSQIFHFKTQKCGKLTKKGHFERSRALYNLSEIFWLQNMLIYFLKTSFLKKLIISPPIKLILTLLKYLNLTQNGPKFLFSLKNLIDFNVRPHIIRRPLGQQIFYVSSQPIVQ